MTKYMKMSDVFWGKDAVIPFRGLEFVKPLSPETLDNLLYIGIGASILVALGLFYRLACVAMTLMLFYALFMTRVTFNNHYYLFALIGLLLCFTMADERVSVRSIFRSRPPSKIPYWNYFILQFQIGIVFFFGGLAKINPDWLTGAVTDPMIWKTFGMFDQLHLASLAFSWAGMLFDLLIPFFLFWKRTRLWAVILVIAFNLTNGLLLFDNIGLFPYAMIVLTVLAFLDTAYLDKFAKKYLSQYIPVGKHKGERRMLIPKSALMIVLAAYFTFQCLFPMRHYVIKGHPEWTDQGSTFAWRMKSSSKLISLKYKAIDKATGKFISDVNMGFTFRMEQLFAFTPYHVWFMGQRVHQRFAERGRPNFGVTVEYYVTMNGQPMQLAIDPTVDLSEVDYYGYKYNDWITPWRRKSREEIETIQQELLEKVDFDMDQLED